MKKIFYLLFVATFFITQPGNADNHSDQLSVLNAKANKTDRDLNMEFVLDYSHLSVPANDQLIVKPVILGSNDTLCLPYLLFPGKTRNKANYRKMRLYGMDGVPFPDPLATIYPTGNTGDIFVYRQTIPFENWMYGARVELWQDVYGCADCHRILAHIPLNNIANRPVVAYIIPQPDTSREERMTLYVGFPWDQAIIRRDFRNNTDELDKIHHSMQRILSYPSGQIRQIQLTGYASPEGKYTYNTDLAGRRVQAVKKYLQEQYPVNDALFFLDTVPEDWEGVKQWILNNNLPHGQAVCDIIERTPNQDARDQYIRQLDGNITYRILLRNAYPPLRRVEYRVNYHIPALTIDESRKIYQSHPERLTPYELYSLANDYSGETPEFREIILATVRIYPKNTAALNNAACVALQEEDPATARTFLLQSQDSPQKTNNQGVVFMLEGNIPEAYRCFLEAGRCGCEEAIINQHNLERAQLQR